VNNEERWSRLLTAAATPAAESKRAEYLTEGIDLGLSVTPDGVGASVTERGPDRFSTPLASNALALQLDDAQYRDDRGPCLDASRSQQVLRIDVIRDTDQYPEFARVAAEQGVHSSLSVPLPGAALPSALNLYATSDSAFDQARPQAIAGLLARCIGALRGSELVEPMSSQRLAAAWQDHAQVQRARDLIADRDGLSTGAAYTRLAMMSSDQRRHILAVARDVIGGNA
jgi:hypothetical protein